jgi:hypothetical protein
MMKFNSEKEGISTTTVSEKTDQKGTKTTSFKIKHRNYYTRKRERHEEKMKKEKEIEFDQIE